MPPPLWLVVRGPARVYLFGQGPWGVREDEEWLPDAHRSAFESSSVFWHEVPDDDRVADGGLLTTYGVSDQPLSHRLDGVVLARVHDAARRVAVDPMVLESCRPWLAAQVLDSALRAEASERLVDVEAVLTARARTAAVRVESEFGDAEALLSTFAGLGYAEVEYLCWTAQRVSQGVAGLRHQAAAWLVGDLSVFEDDVADVRAAFPHLYELIFRTRSEAWLPRIDEMLAGRGSAFVVMGMSHLLGDDGVLRLLEDEIERVV